MSEAGIPEASPSSKPWLKVAVLVVATLAVLALVMPRGEFFWDDYDLIVNNPLIHSAGVKGFLVQHEEFRLFSADVDDVLDRVAAVGRVAAAVSRVERAFAYR